MKPLRLLKLEHANRGGGLLKKEPREGYIRDVYRAVASDWLRLMAALANIHSLEELISLQKSLPPNIELTELSDKDLLKLCGELRVLWEDSQGNGGKQYRAPTHKLFHEWWRHYDLSDPKRWSIFYESRTFFPTEMNWRGIMASLLFENRKHLKQCANCLRYFIGRRRESKYCMQPDCQLAYNNERQKRRLRKKRVN